MSKRKFLITPLGVSNIDHPTRKDINEIIAKENSFIDGESEMWEQSYIETQYCDIYSATDDLVIRNKLTRGIDEKTKIILIPGCGSKTKLQKHIINNYPEVEEVYCTDWSKTSLAHAQTDFYDGKVIYQVQDTRKTTFPNNKFDMVIISNSIVSGQDLSNRLMVDECYRILKPGGIFVGLFPTILGSCDVALLRDNPKANWLLDGTINLYKNTFYERFQNVTQLFYSPLRLRRIFNESGFRDIEFEICFFDSDFCVKESEKIYGIPADSDIYLWEILVKSKK